MMTVSSPAKLFINAIYRATEGEGALVGRPQIFVRVQGCAIGCANCDSKDTWEFEQGFASDITAVLAQIEDLSLKKLKRVSITGGDPLHPKHVPGVLQLVRELKARKFFVSLEAAGTRIVHEIFDLVDFINFDFKPPSTLIETKPSLIVQLAEQYEGKFQLKSVAQDAKDFSAILAAYQLVEKDLKRSITFDWCITPIYNPGESFPLERFKLILNLNENAGGYFRVIGQQHKWVHGPNEKLV